MTLSVTIDSNVFRPIARPSLFPNNSEIVSIQMIHDAICAKKIRAYAVETMIDLEAIIGKDRAAYFSGMSTKTSASETVLKDDTIKLSFAIKPDPTAHPGLNHYFSEPIEAALKIGVTFLRCPRIGLPRPFEIDDNWFATEENETTIKKRQETFFEVCQKIQDRSVGIAILKQLASTFDKGKSQEPWYKHLQNATDNAELKAVQKAVGEWADGDSVAAHIGYQNNYFCTNDDGKSAGKSILDPTNKAWLQTEYGIQIVTPTELAKIISKH